MFLAVKVLQLNQSLFRDKFDTDYLVKLLLGHHGLGYIDLSNFSRNYSLRPRAMFSIFSGSSGASSETKSANGSDTSAEIDSLKQEVEDLRSLLAKTEAKASAAEALSTDGSDVGQLRAKVIDLEGKWALTNKELADAVQKYRLLIIDASKAAQMETVTNAAIKETIQQQKDDFRYRDGTDTINSLNGEVQRLKDLLNQKEKEKDALAKEFQDKHAEWVEKTDQLVGTMGDHKNAHSKVLVTLADEITALQDKSKAVADSVGDKDAQAEKANKNAAQAAEKLDAAEKEQEKLQQQAKNLAMSLSDLNASNSKLSSTNSALNQQITESRNQQILLEGQIDGLNDKMQKAARDHEVALKDMERKQDALKSKLLDTEAELKKANDELQRTLSDVAKAKAAAEAAAKMLADQRELNERALGAKDAANSTASEAAKQLQDLLAGAQKKDDDFRLERKTLLSKIDDLMRQQAENAAVPVVWQKKLDDLSSNKLRELNALMAAHAAENEANAQQLRQLKSINDGLMAQNDELNKKLAQLSRQWDQDKAKISALEAELKATKDKYADLPALLSAAKLENAALQKLTDDQDAIIADLRPQIAKLQGEVAHSTAQLNASRSSSESTNSAVMSELIDAQNQNGFLRDKVADLQTQIAGYEADVANLERQKLELQANNAALKAENKDLGQNIDNLNSNLREKETQLQTEVITKTQRLPEGLQDKIDILTTQLKQVQVLTTSIQLDMVPVEETSYSKQTSSSSSRSSSSSSSSSS